MKPTPSRGGSQEEIPGASFDALIKLLAEQHHHEVAQLKSELKELAWVRTNNVALRRQVRAHTNGPLGVCNTNSEPVRAVTQPEQLPGALEAFAFDMESYSPRRTNSADCLVPPFMSSAKDPKSGSSSAVDDLSKKGVQFLGKPTKRSSIKDQKPASSCPTLEEMSGRSVQFVQNIRTEEEGPTLIRADSDVSQPGEFQLLEVWCEDHSLRTPNGRRGSGSSFSLISAGVNEIMIPRAATSHNLSSASDRLWFIASPTNPWRVGWDFFGALLIFYDLFKLPLEAFDPPETAFTIVMDWFILCFWTANVGASLTVGYLDYGVVVLNPRKILSRYLKTWFSVDLLVLVPDWVFTIEALRQSSQDDVSADATRLLRVLRLVRMMRLLRLLKLRRIIDLLNDMITSEYMSVLANVVTMILILLVINHQICCAWFWVAASQDDAITWVSGFPTEGRWYLYVTSFHWSITQFTPATVDVAPHTLAERVFAVIVVIFALVGFSYMVGSITSSLAQLRNMNAEESNLFWDLRRYLSKNQVRPQLSLRIQKYLEHAWRVQQDRKPNKATQLTSLLSDQLHSELQCELAVVQLQVHPFLAQLCLKSSVTVQRLAATAINHKLFACGDYLFHPGEVATHLWIVVEGSYEYTRIDPSGNLRRELVSKKEDWIAEPSLWTNWIHRGLLSALEDGDDLQIDSKKFREMVVLNPQAHAFASRYAKNFMQWLNKQDPADLSDVSQGEDVSDLHRDFMEEKDDYALIS